MRQLQKITVTKRYMHLWHVCLVMINILVNILVTDRNWPIGFWIIDQRATWHQRFRILFQVCYKIRINTLKLRTDIMSWQNKTDKYELKMCDNNGYLFIATLHNVLLAPDLCDRLFFNYYVNEIGTYLFITEWVLKGVLWSKQEKCVYITR